MPEAPIPARQTIVLCLLLVFPAAALITALAGGGDWRSAIRPSGDYAAKLLLLTLVISPLRTLLPGAQWVGWLLARRRVFGLSAFAYALLHLVVFSASIGRLDWILQGMAFASMWTGWIAFALLLAIAANSNGRAMRRLGAWWKRIQRLAYPAALLTLAHWLLLSRSPVEALLHAAPVIALWGTAAARRLSRSASKAI